jgi:hypothetical protein
MPVLCLCLYPAGAPALGLLATTWISSGFEDFMVLLAAGAASYATILNLPLRYVGSDVSTAERLANAQATGTLLSQSDTC